MCACTSANAGTHTPCRSWMSTVGVTLIVVAIGAQNSRLWLWVPAFARDDASSRHRKAQRLAAARHVDGGKAGDSEATGAAVALFVDLELALARAKLGGAAPVQRPVLELDGAVFGI